MQNYLELIKIFKTETTSDKIIFNVGKFVSIFKK